MLFRRKPMAKRVAPAKQDKPSIEEATSLRIVPGYFTEERMKLLINETRFRPLTR